MSLIKKYWWVALLSLVAVFVIVPVSIKVAFTTTAPFQWLSAEWEANDALSYVGSVLGGLGTIFLGIITVIQTDQIKKIESEKDAANTKRPFFVIEEVLFPEGDNDKWVHGRNGFTCTYTKRKQAYIKIVNMGDGVAINLTFEPWGIGEIPKDWRPKFSISANQSCDVPVFLLAREDTDEQIQSVDVQYTNLLGYAYSQKIEFQIIYSSKIIGITGTDPETGLDAEDREQFWEAKVFNMHPQIPLGMGKYNNEKGNYDI